MSELGKVETVDTAGLVQELERAFGQHPPHGYLEGKTQMRDFVMSRRGVSALEAERLIDSLEANGRIAFLGDPASPRARESLWRIGRGPGPRTG